MKTTILVFVMLLGLQAPAQFISFPENDYTQFSIWTDPVAWEKEGGPQIGLKLTKVMRWGWIAASVSHFEALTPPYSDVVGSGGVNLHLFNYDPVRYYTGLRLGFLFRHDPNGKIYVYGLAGWTWGVEWRLSRPDAPTRIHIGAGYYIDYRADQHDQFYGDSGAYEPGFLTDNPLLQENGFLEITFSWD